MIKEFKEFAMRGNVVDMAVGIIIGGAFGTIVRSLVSDVIMPPLGLLVGGIAFGDLFLTLKDGAVAGPYLTLADAQAEGAVTIAYGSFIDNVVSFVIVAFAVYLLVRTINRLKAADAGPPPAPTERPCPECLSNIPLKATRCAHCTSQVAPA